MKVIFLDLDGVLNCNRTFTLRDRSIEYGDIHKYTKSSIDIYAVGLVNLLVKACNARIVVSSSHRLFFRGDLDGLNNYFAYMGIDTNIYGATTYLGTVRGHEIAAYLNKHTEVTHYVIIDDDGDMLQEQMNNFVQTDGNLGFQVPDFNKAVEILQNDTLSIQRGQKPISPK